MSFKIYSDGAATMRKVNGEYVREAGGFAYVMLDESGEVIMSAYGGTPETTNNRMELKGISCALGKLIAMKVSGEKINIYSDSAYCVNIFTNWIKSWKANGWTRGKKHEPIENVDIIKEIDTKIAALRNSFCEVDFIKVKGHNNVEWNEYVDRCAVMGKLRAKSQNASLYIEGHFFDEKGMDIPRK